MKKRTRIVAWVFIILANLGTLVTLVTVQSMFFGRLAKSGYPVFWGITVITNLAIGICSLIGWPNLLKRRPWAWAMLVAIFGFTAARLPFYIVFEGHSFHGHWLKMILGAGVLIAFPLWVLLTDRPSGWRNPQ